MNNEQKTKVESIVFKKLIEHLQNRTDVQNIDLMNLSGFCRNCLSRWYSEAAEETGLKVDKDHAREIVYGMPHSVWKEKYQTDADEDQKNKFKNSITKRSLTWMKTQKITKKQFKKRMINLRVL